MSTRLRFAIALAALLALPALASDQPLVGGKFREFDANGIPLAGGKLYTYAAGTTTPQATYTDSTGSVQNANPVVLDSTGRADVWLTPGLLYKLVLQDSSGNTIYTEDNFPSANSTVTTAFTAPVTVNVSSTTGVGVTVTGDPNGNSAVVSTAGNGSSNAGGTGWAAGQFIGGNQTVSGRQGGYAVIALGGNGIGTGSGGRGIHSNGGPGGATGTGGIGVRAAGGAGGSTSGNGGDGLNGTGGTVTSGTGGNGIAATGAASTGSNQGGAGGVFQGGAGGSSAGNGGPGIIATAGMAGSGGASATGVIGTGAGVGLGGSFANGTAATGGARQDALAVTNGDISMSGVANAAYNTWVNNRMVPNGLVKASFIANTGASPTLSTAVGGFGASSISCASSNITVTLGGQMAGIIPVCTVNSSSATGRWVVINAVSTANPSTITISGFNASGQDNLCSVNEAINCVVLGTE